MKKDKQKVLGEVFSEERIRTFLDLEPPAGVERSYHLLEKAYRGMVPENFETFVTLFVEAGYDLEAPGPDGKSFADTIADHSHSAPYLQALRATS